MGKIRPLLLFFLLFCLFYFFWEMCRVFSYLIAESWMKNKDVNMAILWDLKYIAIYLFSIQFLIHDTMSQERSLKHKTVI